MNMNANNNEKQTQQLVTLFKKDYAVEVERKIEYPHARKIDVVIKDKKDDKKIYIEFKGKNTRPAMFADVVNLDYIRLMDRKSGKDNYRYMIFCEKEKNTMAELAAKDVKIQYYKNFNELVRQIKKYLIA